jgi:hypothetical protein
MPGFFFKNDFFFIKIIESFFRLRLIAPVIRDHGIEYERGKYADKFNSGELNDEIVTV